MAIMRTRTSTATMEQPADQQNEEIHVQDRFDYISMKITSSGPEDIEASRGRSCRLLARECPSTGRSQVATARG